MKITHFDVLRGRLFVDLEQASRRVPKIMQNYAKVHLKSPQNEHEKKWSTVSQRQKTHAVASPVKMHQNAFIFVAPDFALHKPWMQKTFKIAEN